MFDRQDHSSKFRIQQGGSCSLATASASEPAQGGLFVCSRVCRLAGHGQSFKVCPPISVLFAYHGKAQHFAGDLWAMSSSERLGSEWQRLSLVWSHRSTGSLCRSGPNACGGWLWAYDGLFVGSRVHCGFDAGMPNRAVGPALSFIFDRATCFVAVAGRRRVSGSLAECGKMPECDVIFLCV